MIERIYDVELINSVVLSLIDDIVEDDTSHDCFKVDVEADCWLSCYVNNEFCGLYQAVAYNRTTLDVHCYILKDKRNYSKAIGKEAMKWLSDNSPAMYKQFITTFPILYPHIKKYVEGLGFQLAGVLSGAFKKNGNYYDILYYQLPRYSKKEPLL